MISFVYLNFIFVSIFNPYKFMGSRASSMSKREESVYTLLEIDENSTPAQIKQNYIRLLRKHHPDYGKEKDINKTQQIIAAYNKLKDKNFKILTMELFENINFYKYSLTYFQRLENLVFIAEVNKIYKTVVANENVYFQNGIYPKFGDHNSKIQSINTFYNFFKNFKTNVRFERNINNKNIYDKYYDKEERRIYNENIRKMTNGIYLCDYRIKKNVFESVVTVVTEREEKVRFKKKKDVEKYAFYCDACKKGFMSDKTMKNHLKSEKHEKNIKLLGLENKDMHEIMSEVIKEKQNESVDLKENEYNDDALQCKFESDDKPQINEENIIDDQSTDQIENNMYDKYNTAEIATNKIINLKIKGSKHKTTKKKPVNHKDKETLQMLTCANCKRTFESRNKLFTHIKTDHMSKDNFNKNK